MSRNSVVDIIIKFADRNSPILVRISLPLQGFQQIICKEAMFELSEIERNVIGLGCCRDKASFSLSELFDKVSGDASGSRRGPSKTGWLPCAGGLRKWAGRAAEIL
jgi:hypothetical protein